MKLTVIGTGNLGRALINGAIFARVLRPGQIIATRRNLDLLKDFAALGIETTTDNCFAVKEADLVILAVESKAIEKVASELSDSLKSDACVVSLAAGVKKAKICSALKNKCQVIRAMPNIAMSIAASMTAIVCDNDNAVTRRAIEFFKKLGEVEIINESLMPAATVAGSCSTAFSLRFIRAASLAGVQMGFESEKATKIAAQTLKGACEIILQNSTHPEAEIDKVTTPAGATISGLNVLDEESFNAALIKAMLTSYNKIK